MTTTRIAACFEALAAAGRPGFVAYVMAGDPGAEETARILEGLPGAGADIIELGFPFSDPMADGPAIQKAGLRALASGTTLAGTLDLAKGFRAKNAHTPLILMGYLNPLETMGLDRFAARAADSGVDGVIIVDVPPEEDEELRAALSAHGLALIRLATPTTDEKRLPAVLNGVSGFVYYVSVAGITGDKAIDVGPVKAAVARLKAASNLPVAVGFGIRTPEAAAATAAHADAVVVGSAIVDAIATAHETGGDPVEAALALTRTLSGAAHQAKGKAA
jgi:tryptophan synthase alpha chain